LQLQLLSRFAFLQAQTRWRNDTAASVAAAAFTVVAAPSVEPALMGAGLTVVGFAVALTAVVFVAAAFVAIGSTIVASMTGLFSLAILGTRSFTIPIPITDTIPTGTILTGTILTGTILTGTDTDTVVFAAAVFAAVTFAAVVFTAVASVAVGDSYNQPVYQGSGGYTDELVEQIQFRPACADYHNGLRFGHLAFLKIAFFG
jgi:hypothetical protein